MACPSDGPRRWDMSPVRGDVWCLAHGGRVQLLSTSTGRVVSTVDPSYAKPSGWSQNSDLVVDTTRGIGYVSWASASSDTNGMKIDRIDPAARTRMTLKRASGGQLVAVMGTGRVLAWDMSQVLVMLDPRTGRTMKTLASPAALLVGGGKGGGTQGQLSGPLDVAQDGERVVLVFAATVPFQNTISGDNTAPGVVIVTLRDVV